MVSISSKNYEEVQKKILENALNEEIYFETDKEFEN